MSTARYDGSCQCGAVSFTVDLDLGGAITCDCSRCRRLGAVLAFSPRGAFTLLQGEDALTDYLFNRHVIRHRFCRICGVEPLAYGVMPDGTEMVAVNVNCLDGVDPRSLSTTHHHGAAD